VHVAALRRASAIERIGGQAIALKDRDVLEVIGERPRGRQAADAGADDDRLPSEGSGHRA